MMSKVSLETDAVAATARRAASLMFNEHDLSEGDALARACALICEMLVGWTRRHEREDGSDRNPPECVRRSDNGGPLSASAPEQRPYPR